MFKSSKSGAGATKTTAGSSDSDGERCLERRNNNRNISRGRGGRNGNDVRGDRRRSLERGGNVDNRGGGVGGRRSRSRPRKSPSRMIGKGGNTAAAGRDGPMLRSGGVGSVHSNDDGRAGPDGDYSTSLALVPVSSPTTAATANNQSVASKSVSSRSQRSDGRSDSNHKSSATGSSSPAFPGAKFNSKGYCINHPSLRLQERIFDRWLIIHNCCPRCVDEGLIENTTASNSSSRGRGVGGNFDEGGEEPWANDDDVRKGGGRAFSRGRGDQSRGKSRGRSTSRPRSKSFMKRLGGLSRGRFRKQSETDRSDSPPRSVSPVNSIGGGGGGHRRGINHNYNGNNSRSPSPSSVSSRPRSNSPMRSRSGSRRSFSPRSKAGGSISPNSFSRRSFSRGSRSPSLRRRDSFGREMPGGARSKSPFHGRQQQQQGMRRRNTASRSSFSRSPSPPPQYGRRQSSVSRGRLPYRSRSNSMQRRPSSRSSLRSHSPDSFRGRSSMNNSLCDSRGSLKNSLGPSPLRGGSGGRRASLNNSLYDNSFMTFQSGDEYGSYRSRSPPMRASRSFHSRSPPRNRGNFGGPRRAVSNGRPRGLSNGRTMPRSNSRGRGPASPQCADSFALVVRDRTPSPEASVELNPNRRRPGVGGGNDFPRRCPPSRPSSPQVYINGSGSEASSVSGSDSLESSSLQDFFDDRRGVVVRRRMSPRRRDNSLEREKPMIQNSRLSPMSRRDNSFERLPPVSTRDNSFETLPPRRDHSFERLPQNQRRGNSLERIPLRNNSLERIPARHEWSEHSQVRSKATDLSYLTNQVNEPRVADRSIASMSQRRIARIGDRGTSPLSQRRNTVNDGLRSTSPVSRSRSTLSIRRSISPMSQRMNILGMQRSISPASRRRNTLGFHRSISPVSPRRNSRAMDRSLSLSSRRRASGGVRSTSVGPRPSEQQPRIWHEIQSMQRDRSFGRTRPVGNQNDTIQRGQKSIDMANVQKALRQIKAMDEKQGSNFPRVDSLSAMEDRGIPRVNSRPSIEHESLPRVNPRPSMMIPGPPPVRSADRSPMSNPISPPHSRPQSPRMIHDNYNMQFNNGLSRGGPASVVSGMAKSSMSAVPPPPPPPPPRPSKSPIPPLQQQQQHYQQQQHQQMYQQQDFPLNKAESGSGDWRQYQVGSGGRDVSAGRDGVEMNVIQNSSPEYRNEDWAKYKVCDDKSGVGDASASVGRSVSSGRKGERKSKSKMFGKAPEKFADNDRTDAKGVKQMPYTDQFGDFGLYTGIINKDGRPHGKGSMKYNNGVFYEGTWTDGCQDQMAASQYGRIRGGFTSWQGKGKNATRSGMVLPWNARKNDAHDPNEKMNVRGMEWTDLNGDTGRYTGEVNSDKLPHGSGIMKYNFGLIAEGEWINGVLKEGPQDRLISAAASMMSGARSVGPASVMAGGMSVGPSGMSVGGGISVSQLSAFGAGGMSVGPMTVGPGSVMPGMTPPMPMMYPQPMMQIGGMNPMMMARPNNASQHAMIAQQNAALKSMGMYGGGMSVGPGGSVFGGGSVYGGPPQMQQMQMQMQPQIQMPPMQQQMQMMPVPMQQPPQSAPQDPNKPPISEIKIP
ncbi:predicted protein [Thalassiosira pseudonana CCMP1335]|uniref:Uncharacterized protein n=1 Tax=Thalassiosira pseudonana TaxID=35128 RepID=B8CFX1_THAPS|nr:predicted protein [Thalassiosira pseudonana CCMP1335]EED87704.1 predicted protein [Thalassiosira pseudonana CCMP1335]